jgi:predicted phage-related endonuclease
MNTFSNTELRQLADQYGNLKAQMAELEDQCNMLKQMLIDADQPIIEGHLFRVTVSDSVRESLDTKALKADYPALVMQYMRSTSVVTVRCSSR